MWIDITRTMAMPYGTPAATIGWRVPSKGRPFGEICFNKRMMEALYEAFEWELKQEVQILVNQNRTMLQLRPVQTDGKKMGQHGASGSLAHALPWVQSGPRKSESLRHEMTLAGIILHLPDWACGTAAADHVPEARKMVGEAAPAPEAEPLPQAALPALTEERKALIRAAWMNPGVSMTDLLAMLARLPGRAFASSSPIYAFAKKAGLPSPRAYAVMQNQAAEPEGAEPPPRPALPVFVPPAPAPEPETVALPPEPAPVAVATAPPPVPVLSGGPAEPVIVRARDTVRSLRLEIAELMAAGKRGRAIADETGLGLSEVLSHVAAIEARQKAGMPP